MKKGHKDTEKRPPCEDEGRDWSDAGTSRRMPGPPEAGGSSGGLFPLAFRGHMVLLTP